MNKPKTKKPKSGSGNPKEAPSEEFRAFEDLAKKVLAVPKSELDKREDEYQMGRHPS